MRVASHAAAANNARMEQTVSASAARGKVTAVKDGVLQFAPSGTNYELHLVTPPGAADVGRLVEGVVRVRARKVWTVPSGGNFISPIFGPPRTIQGRVKSLSERELVVHAGLPIVVELPAEAQGYDLARGPIAVGVMVNVVALPGATFEALPTERA
jgi:hypothetical protein